MYILCLDVDVGVDCISYIMYNSILSINLKILYTSTPINLKIPHLPISITNHQSDIKTIYLSIFPLTNYQLYIYIYISINQRFDLIFFPSPFPFPFSFPCPFFSFFSKLPLPLLLLCLYFSIFFYQSIILHLPFSLYSNTTPQ